TDVTHNLVAKQAFGYDSYNNRQDVWEYDFGSDGPPDNPTRHTHINYLTTNVVNGTTYNYATNSSIHIRNLAKDRNLYSVNPTNGNETLVAQAVYEYDQYGTSAGHAALTDRTNI